MKNDICIELSGIIKGILADGIVHQSEVEFLLYWLEDNFNHSDIENESIEFINYSLVKVMEDGVLDKEEAEEIESLFNDFLSGELAEDFLFEDETDKNNSIVTAEFNSPFCSPAPSITFQDKVFCFSGDFNLGSRSYCENLIIKHGAKPSKSITKKVNYLIIGSNDSESWKYGSYGRKIEKAIEYRDKNTGIEIVSEEHFRNFIDKNIADNMFGIDLITEIKKNTAVKIKNDFIVFDFETTGFSPLYDEIIEIGAVKVSNGEIVETFESFLKPYKKISKQITAINGIDNDMVSNAPTIDIVIQEFYKFIEELPLVAHNAPFDMKFLLKNLEDSNLVFKNNEVIDTLPLARIAHPEYENHKLSTLIKNLNIDIKISHRALADAKATFLVHKSF